MRRTKLVYAFVLFVSLLVWRGEGFVVMADNLFGTFYLVRYEGYPQPLCANGLCYAIHCPVDGCRIPAQTAVCETMECVLALVKKRGEDHLTGVYRVEFRHDDATQVQVRKLEVKKSFEITE